MPSSHLASSVILSGDQGGSKVISTLQAFTFSTSPTRISTSQITSQTARHRLLQLPAHWVVARLVVQNKLQFLLTSMFLAVPHRHRQVPMPVSLVGRLLPGIVGHACERHSLYRQARRHRSKSPASA